MKYIINSEKKIVTQKATMEKPGVQVHEYQHEYEAIWEKYHEHLASLKSFPAEWVTADQDGKEVTEGVDFEFKKLPFDEKFADTQHRIITRPLHPVAVAIPAKVNYEPGVYSAMTEAGKNDMEERYGKLPAEKEGGGEILNDIEKDLRSIILSYPIHGAHPYYDMIGKVFEKVKKYNNE